MKVQRFIALTAALAFAGTTALAFQEQTGGGTPAEQAAPGPAAAPDKTPPSVEFGSTATPAKSEGTEISIPGLGKLGVLPKMDFGLELLYGANDGKGPAAVEELQSPAGDDVTIRGSVKHKF